MHRDSRWWMVAIIGGAATYIAGHFDDFPFIPKDYQGTVELIGFLATLIGGVSVSSPLPHSEKPGDPAFDAKRLVGK